MSNSRGEYDYYEHEHGKVAEGFAKWAPASERERNAYEQSKIVDAQGIRNTENIHERDEGGHLIADKLGGSGRSENLTAQNHDTNVQMRHIENHVTALAKEDERNMEVSKDTSTDKNATFYQVISYGNDAQSRPDNYMINITHVDDQGNVTKENESIMNYSKSEQEEWEKDAEELYKDDDPRPNSQYNPEEDEVIEEGKENEQENDNHDKEAEHDQGIEHDQGEENVEEVDDEKEQERDDAQGTVASDESSEEESFEEGVEINDV